MTSTARLDHVQVELLGRFRVVVGEREVADWSTRRAQELVQVLALTHGRRMARDQIIEQLWPHLGAKAGAANLRKAAHHARRALGDPEAVALRAGNVELFPGRTVSTDVEYFLRGRGRRDGERRPRGLRSSRSHLVGRAAA